MKILEERASPASSDMSMISGWQMDQPDNSQRSGTLRPRIKQQETGSPVSSDMSMDQPGHFQQSLAHKNKPDGKASPASSHVSVKSEWSMDHPENFQGSVALSPRLELERGASPLSTHESEKSDWSVDQHNNVQGGDPSNLYILLSEDSRCPVCADVLKDPVSIPCGHSYCRQCITSHWAQPNHAGHYACPQCSHTYSSRPALYTNSALAQLIEKLQQFSPVPPAHCYAGPGDVACDVCTGRKLRAVKSCLTCSASYCECHIRQHYTVPALQRHRMIGLTGILDQMICQKHNRALEIFCKTDTMFICCMCALEEHKHHIIKTEDPQQGTLQRSETDTSKREIELMETNLRLLKEGSTVDVTMGIKSRINLKIKKIEGKSKQKTTRNKKMRPNITGLKVKITKLEKEVSDLRKEKREQRKQIKLICENSGLREIMMKDKQRNTGKEQEISKLLMESHAMELSFCKH